MPSFMTVERIAIAAVALLAAIAFISAIRARADLATAIGKKTIDNAARGIQ